VHAHIATLLLSAAVHYISESRVYTEAKVVALEAVALQQTSEISKREHAAMLQLEAEQERVRERERSLQGENASTVYPGTRICSTIHE
jgi:hypothetical protein